MRSVKPGRGPSMLGGIMGIVVGLGGVIWTVVAFSIGAGPIALFGVVFIAAAVCITVYSFRNASAQNRYSAFDITESGEEPDPLNERFGAKPAAPTAPTAPAAGGFCPYCGAKTQSDYEFCSVCGRKLPQIRQI